MTKKLISKLKGIPASYGIVKGKVKVVCNPRDINKLKSSEILVTKFTNPLFTPAILKASAIITDTGGKLCHAAIVAREFGIACVVGTEKATRVLRDGMNVIVDGEKGIIYYKNGQH